MGAAESSNAVYTGVHDPAFFADAAVKPWPSGFPSFADTYDGTTVVIVSYNVGFLASTDRNGYYNFRTQDIAAAEEFIVNVYNSSEFGLTHKATGQPVYLYTSDNESFVLGSAYRGNEGEKRFYLSPVRGGAERINLFETKYLTGGIPFFMKSPITNRALAPLASSFRSWDVSEEQRVPVVFYIKSEADFGPALRAITDYYKDPALFSANCCMRKYTTDSVEGTSALRTCIGINLAANPGACDNFMDNKFCVANPLHEYCGCSDAALDRDIKLLPVDAQAYKQILMAQPRCWSVNCAQKAYQNAIRRASTPVCNNTFCTQNLGLGGANNISTNVSAGQTCIGGIIKADAQTGGSGSAAGSATSSGGSATPPVTTGPTNSNPNDSAPVNGGVPNVGAPGTQGIPPGTVASPGLTPSGAVNGGAGAASSTTTTSVLPTSSTILGLSSTTFYVLLLVLLIVVVVIIVAVASRKKKAVSAAPGDAIPVK